MSIEYVLLIKQQQVCLFQIPPVSSSKGYYLDDWKEMFWEGGIKLTEKGGLLNLYFIDKNTSAVQTFVNLPDNPYEAIEKTVNSQRGYAIRLVAPNGVYRWVGCVFRDRNDAFDFNEKILKFISDREMERNPEKFQNEFQPQYDFSLKQGQKIQLSLGDPQQKKTQQPKQAAANLENFKFAPPPDFGDFNQFSQPQQPQQQNTQSGWGNFDMNSWGTFQSAAPQPPQQNQVNQPQKQSQSKGNDINLLDL